MNDRAVGRLQEIAPAVWVAAAPHRFIGLHIGTRMTVVRLASGALVLHSPIPMDSVLRSEIDALGSVRHIVCPNVFHHLYAAEAASAYPQAILHGPRKLWEKRKDLKFGAELSDTPRPDWKGELLPLTIRGCLLRETVFFHPATRTLIASDLVENFRTMPHAATRLYLRLGGVLGHVGWHPLLRIVYRDRRLARQCVDQLLQWPFERVVVAHGEIITENARNAVRDGLAWL